MKELETRIAVVDRTMSWCQYRLWTDVVHLKIQVLMCAEPSVYKDDTFVGIQVRNSLFRLGNMDCSLFTTEKQKVWPSTEANYIHFAVRPRIPLSILGPVVVSLFHIHFQRCNADSSMKIVQVSYSCRRI